MKLGAFQTSDLDWSFLFSADMPEGVKILSACKPVAAFLVLSLSSRTPNQ